MNFRKKNKTMNTLTTEQEKEIFECYKKGMHRMLITRIYKISGNRFQQIIRNHIYKEDNKKHRLKK